MQNQPATQSPASKFGYFLLASAPFEFLPDEFSGIGGFDGAANFIAGLFGGGVRAVCGRVPYPVAFRCCDREFFDSGKLKIRAFFDVIVEVDSALVGDDQAAADSLVDSIRKSSGGAFLLETAGDFPYVIASFVGGKDTRRFAPGIRGGDSPGRSIRVAFVCLDAGVPPSAPNFQMLVDGSECVCLLIEAHKPRIVSTGFDGCPLVLYCSETSGPKIEARFETLRGWSVFSASSSKDGVSVCLLPGA